MYEGVPIAIPCVSVPRPSSSFDSPKSNTLYTRALSTKKMLCGLTSRGTIATARAASSARAEDALEIASRFAEQGIASRDLAEGAFEALDGFSHGTLALTPELVHAEEGELRRDGDAEQRRTVHARMKPSDVRHETERD